MVRNPHRRFGFTVLPAKQPIALAVLGVFVAAISPAIAAPVITPAIHGPFTPSTATDEVFFAADVSNADLLQQPGVTATHGAYMAFGSGPAGLNDGNAGGDYDAVGLAALDGVAWAMDGDNASWSEFELGVGTGQGYDISRIQSIAAWQGAGFSNQKYDVLVKYLGGATFVPLVTVDYQPFSVELNEGGSTKVSVADDLGVLASGVVAIRFSFLDTISNDVGGVVMREIDVFGAPTPEPVTLALLAVGGLVAMRRRR